MFGTWLIKPIAALLALAALAFAVHRLDASRQQVGYDRAVAEYAAAAAKAAQEVRDTETRAAVALQKVEQRHEDTKKRAATAAAGAAAELDGLRGDLAARDSAAGPNPPATCRADAARAERELLGQCAQSLARVAKEADRLEGRLTSLQDYVRTVIGELAQPPP